ncbi:metal-sensitive transcriptional regulator [Sporosalibacterium faouarense]|uniref:metal-sensitive transcriptional regulator n=1 Tax=Sporosalibacterium faouarense TaxID=516123 RepID=UPI00192B5143|nr:metal-sensitive transcriptional regulator [Sporosalibacterium faouarense]
MFESENMKQSTLDRLKKIEGQVKGIQRMIEEERYCNDVLVQIAAVRSAINKVGGLVLENHLRTCVKDSLNNDSEDEVMNNLINTMLKFIK